MTQCHQKRKNSFVDASVDQELPDEVIFNIVSRLPVQTIIGCKCVCKKWHTLVSESYFVELYLSRSPEVLLINHYSFSMQTNGTTLEFREWEETNHNYLLNERFRRFNLDVMDLLRKIVDPVGTVNGLICLWEYGPDDTYICNPVTKEYMVLPKHQFYAQDISEVRYGFGVSMSGKYKVVRIFRKRGSRKPIKIEVYTLGTDQWRTLDQVSYYLGGKENHGLFFNGHVHWILADHQLYSLDLETETFQLFPSPPVKLETRYIHQFLGVLKGCLARIYISSCGITIWAMKEHGVKTSWHKELVIKESNFLMRLKMWSPLCVVDGLNGTSIMISHVKHERKLVAYCLETSIYEETEISERTHVTAMTYRPSFLTLQNFQ